MFLNLYKTINNFWELSASWVWRHVGGLTKRGGYKKNDHVTDQVTDQDKLTTTVDAS